jgi:hypothetical protein
MGKRRTDTPNRDKFYDDDDDDDEIIEEESNLEREPLNPQQIANIQSRKKLIAKRRSINPIESVVSSVFATSATSTAPLGLTNGSSSSISLETSSPFAGFKGFSAYKPSESESSSLSRNINTNLTNGVHSSTSEFSAPASAALPLSSLINGSKSSINGQTEANTGSFKPSSASTIADNKAITSTITSNGNGSNSQNFSQNEIDFINGLDELFTKCYGVKRVYKLPFELSSFTKLPGEENTTDDKYAYFLGELNKHCAKWITQNVEESPYVILTPVFVDYFNYLMLLEKHFFPDSFSEKKSKLNGASSISNSATFSPSLSTISSTTLINDSHKYFNGHNEQHKDNNEKHETVQISAEKKNIEISEDEDEKIKQRLLDSSKTFASLMKNSPLFSGGSTSGSSTSSGGFFKLESTKSTTETKNEIQDLSSSKKSDSPSKPSILTNTTPSFKFGSTTTTATPPVSLSILSAPPQTFNETQTSVLSTGPKLSFGSVHNPGIDSTNNDTAITNSKNHPSPAKSSIFSSLITGNKKPQQEANSNLTIFTVATGQSAFPSITNNKESSKDASPFKISTSSENSSVESTKNATPSSSTKNSSPLITPSSASTTPFSSIVFKPFANTDSIKSESTSSHQIGTSAPPNSVASSTPSSIFSNVLSSSSTSSSSTPFSSGFQQNKNSLFSSSTFGSSSTGATGGSIFGSLGSTSTVSPFANIGTSNAIQSSEGGGGGDDVDEEPYEPPKPEVNEVKEEGSVYTKRIKLFYFNEKESKFCERGIGNLFLKPMSNGLKTQLIVRADTSLANILLNVSLNKLQPVAKASNKDVTYVCVPNPPILNVDDKLPCKFLFKVKTEQDANELFDKLNEFKR